MTWVLSTHASEEEGVVSIAISAGQGLTHLHIGRDRLKELLARLGDEPPIQDPPLWIEKIKGVLYVRRGGNLLRLSRSDVEEIIEALE